MAINQRLYRHVDIDCSICGSFTRTSHGADRSPRSGEICLTAASDGSILGNERLPFPDAVSFSGLITALRAHLMGSPFATADMPAEFDRTIFMACQMAVSATAIDQLAAVC